MYRKSSRNENLARQFFLNNLKAVAIRRNDAFALYHLHLAAETQNLSATHGPVLADVDGHGRRQVTSNPLAVITEEKERQKKFEEARLLQQQKGVRDFFTNKFTATIFTLHSIVYRWKKVLQSMAPF